MKNWIRQNIAPFAIYWFYRLWSSTWRIEIFENESLRSLIKEKQPFIFAIWHGDEIAMMVFARIYRVATMSSTSADGDMMDKVLRKFGFETSRGSSTRGGARALIGLLKLMRTGRAAVVTVDGPKGPYHVPKPGVFELSRHMKCAIIPGAIGCSNAYVFKKSWNKTYLPLPFAKVFLEWGEPLAPVEESEDPRSEALARALQLKLDAVGHSVGKKVQ